MDSVEDLRRRYDGERRWRGLDALPRFDDGGLVLGRGTVLARVGTGVAYLDGDRLAALLLVAHGYAVAPTVVKHAHRAAEYWQQGKAALAHIELAFARLPRLGAENDAFRLFLAEVLLDDGLLPRDLARALGVVLAKYDPDQPRNPAGSGVDSGRWAKNPAAAGPAAAASVAPAASAVRALAPEAPSLAEGLGAEALAWLTRLAGRLALPVALFGAAFVPSPNAGVAEEGTVPGQPGVRYHLDHDTGTLRLFSEANGAAPALVAQLGADGVYRDVDTRRAIARALEEGVALIDLDRVPVAKAIERVVEPKLCPAPQPDREGGRMTFDVMYEQYVRDAVNPQRQPQLPPGLTFALPSDTASGWVFFDDCRESDGAMIEAKGNYAGTLSKPYGPEALTRDWLRQANNQVRAAGNRRVEWYFHDPAAAIFAKGLFAAGGLDSIGINVLPFPGGVPRPNPRLR